MNFSEKGTMGWIVVQRARGEWSDHSGLTTGVVGEGLAGLGFAGQFESAGGAG